LDFQYIVVYNDRGYYIWVGFGFWKVKALLKAAESGGCMRCPYCGHEDSRVVDTRTTEEGSIVRRRRECLGCGRRFTTYERVEEVPLVVVKKDGRREVFDRNKILRGVIKACDKRSTAVPVLEQLVDEVEKDLRNLMEPEITSEQIGERVMERLRQVDEVAYVRFASVYRRFTDAQRFIQEVQALLKNHAGD